MAGRRRIPKCLEAIADRLKTYRDGEIGYLYFLVDQGELVYIGSTHSLERRIRQHRRDKQFDDVLYVPLELTDARRIEAIFILKLMPRLNINGLPGRPTSKRPPFPAYQGLAREGEYL